jgi:rhodanese-related sulfurtransferase
MLQHFDKLSHLKPLSIMRKLIPSLLFLLPLIATTQNIYHLPSQEAVVILENLNSASESLIDCRSKQMFEKEHLTGAVCVDAFDTNLESLLIPFLSNKRLVLYCTGNNRSEIVSQRLQSLDYAGEIVIIHDGITGWIAGGLKTGKTQQAENTDASEKIKDKTAKGKPIIQVFGNFDFNASADAEKKYGFWFGRAHFGYEYQFSSQFSGKIILDMGRPTTLGQIVVTDTAGNPLNVSSTGKDGSYYAMTLKFASLEWKPNEIIRIQAGGILQNHYITQEKFWGYRYLAETFQDRYYHIPSGDLGAIAYVKVSEKLGFDVALTNGEGFRFDQDAFGDVKVASGIDYRPIEGLQTRIYWDHTSSDNPQKPAVQQLLSAFAGYSFGDKFRLAGEYNHRINHLNINNHELYGYSLSGSYRVFEGVEVFARFDRLMANTLSGESENWYALNTGKALITGVHYNPVKGINVSLNYQAWLPDSGESEQMHHVLLSFEYKL